MPFGTRFLAETVPKAYHKIHETHINYNLNSY